MPGKHEDNTDPKDENKKLETTENFSPESVTVSEEPAPVVREITQTDRLNKRLLVSLLENMNKNQFFEMGNSTSNHTTDSSDNNSETDADWK